MNKNIIWIIALLMLPVALATTYTLQVEMHAGVNTSTTTLVQYSGDHLDITYDAYLSGVSRLNFTNSTSQYLYTYINVPVLIPVGNYVSYVNLDNGGDHLNITYNINIYCQELWIETTDFSSCQTESTPLEYQTYTKTYADTNTCNTAIDLPGDNGTVTRCSVPGWDELMNGEPGLAAYKALDQPMGGYLILILWIVISFVIITKTGSWELSFTLGIIFGVFFLSSEWFGSAQKVVFLLILILQLTVTLFRIASKEKNL